MTQVSTTTNPGSDTGDGATERARAVASEGKEQVGEIAQHARQQASELVDQVRNEVRSQTDQQAQRINTAMRDVGRQLRDLADGNPSDGPVRSLAREAADRVEALSSRFDGTGIDGTLTSARDFARRRPLVFLAGALTAGMLVGRVLRNSDTKAIVHGGSAGSQADGSAPMMSGDGYGLPTPGTSASSADAPIAGMPPVDLAGASFPTGSVGPEIDLNRSES